MIKSSASVHWEGSGKDGHGQISTQSGALDAYPYGFASRFTDDRKGSNPEELVGAAHAACYAMAFSFACAEAGLATSVVDTGAVVHLDKVEGGFAIQRIDLTLRAKVPGADAAKFQELANAAKQNCPLSKALASVPTISLDAQLL